MRVLSSTRRATPKGDRDHHIYWAILVSAEKLHKPDGYHFDYLQVLRLSYLVERGILAGLSELTAVRIVSLHDCTRDWGSHPVLFRSPITNQIISYRGCTNYV